VGWARLGSCFSSADLGIARDTRGAGRQLSSPAGHLGLASSSSRSGSELGSGSGGTAGRGARPFMGSSGALCFASARCAGGSSGCPVMGCSGRPRTVMGRAARPDWTSSRTPSGSTRTRVGITGHRRAGKARGAGHVMEPAGSVMGPAQARRAAGTPAVLRSRLGIASRSIRAAADRSARLGRAGTFRLGCAQNRGARSAPRAVMVGPRRTRGATGADIGRSAILERASSNRRMVGARTRSRRDSTPNRRPACRGRRQRGGSCCSARRAGETSRGYAPLGAAGPSRAEPL
jgi:hypothetical protein